MDAPTLRRLASAKQRSDAKREAVSFPYSSTGLQSESGRGVIFVGVSFVLLRSGNTTEVDTNPRETPHGSTRNVFASHQYELRRNESAAAAAKASDRENWCERETPIEKVKATVEGVAVGKQSSPKAFGGNRN
jgi:hypothetical protein